MSNCVQKTNAYLKIVVSDKVWTTSLCTCVCCMYTGVVIGFEAARYIVSKPAQNVTVGVAVLSGGLSRDIEVTVETADDTARGECNTHPL